MLACPHCDEEIRSDDLRRYPSLFANYKVCPYCEGRFTVDRRTKRLHLLALIVAVVSLAFTMLLYYRSTVWLVPSIASYVVLGAIIFLGNRRMYLVPSD